MHFLPAVHTLMEIARESSIEGCPDGKPSSPLPIKLFPQGHDGSHTVSSELFELFLCFIYRPSTPIKDVNLTFFATPPCLISPNDGIDI